MYNRRAAVEYAHKWAFGRNPAYADFSGYGGDCTNFISQCLHAGGAPMDFTRTFGWYYRNINDRAPAWTGVQYLYNFLTRNEGRGTRAAQVDVNQIQLGDVVQLAFTPGIYSHSLLVVSVGNQPAPENIFIATHSNDADYRPLTGYQVASRRYLSISVT